MAVVDHRRRAGGERQIVGRGRAQNGLRLRPHHRQDRPRRGDVGENRHVVTDMAADPVGIARRLSRAGDDEEGVLGKADHREVALEAAAAVQ